MENHWYNSLSTAAIAGELLPQETYDTLLNDSRVEILSLLHAAFQVRKHFHGKEVTVHILNNVSNGLCSEDCNYCAQSSGSSAEIIEYQEKSDSEIMAEAEQAYEAGAHRYCMVYAGRGKNQKRAAKIAKLVTSIKEKYPIEVCVSAGRRAWRRSTYGVGVGRSRRRSRHFRWARHAPLSRWRDHGCPRNHYRPV